jgi:hypothetical protein
MLCIRTGLSSGWKPPHLCGGRSASALREVFPVRLCALALVAAKKRGPLWFAALMLCYQGTTLVGRTGRQQRSRLKSLRENSALSPEGTAESSPGRQSWVDVTKTEPVPSGTTEILSSSVQSSLTGPIGIVSDFPGLTSWAALSRPFGTQCRVLTQTL